LWLWDPEVGLGALVWADVDAVDEFLQELFDGVRIFVLQGLSYVTGDAAPMLGVGYGGRGCLELL